MAAFLAKQQLEKQGAVISLGATAEQADQAIATRVAEAFASLPLDVQEAIRNASSPAIAQLLKLAAMTASGIKDAPAVMQSSATPLANQPKDAAAMLVQQFGEADAFKLANALRTIMGELSLSADLETSRSVYSLRPGAVNAQQQAAMLAASGALSADASENAVLSSGLAQGNLAQSPDALANRVAQAYGAPASALASALDALLLSGPAASNADGAESLATHALIAAGAAQEAADSQVLQGNVQSPQGSTPSSQPSSAAAQASLAAAQAAARAEVLVHVGSENPFRISVQQAEQGLREGLKLLMDGRMLWQGQFTPGVPLKLERSDAWRADRRATGGMGKGTSIRVQLQLPNLDLLEIRALGFGGQVSVRMHADPASTSTFANSLPDLIARLKERGLAGTQVAVDSL